MILDICNIPAVEKLLRLVKILIWGIRILVPILLIFSGTKTFMAKITNNDDLSKPLKKLVIMVAAAICVFLIPTFINLIFDLTGNSDSKCLDALNSQNIVIDYYNDTDYI